MKIPEIRGCLFSSSSINSIAIVFMLCLFAFNSKGWSRELTASQIMKKVSEREQATTLSSTVEMILTGKDGMQRTRKIRSFIKRYDDVTKRAIFFLEPPDVRGTGFLTFDYSSADRQDEQWIFLPAMHKTKRISAGNRSGSFMGSDFSYGDMTQKNPEEYRYSLLKQTQTETHMEWVIEAVPANDEIADRDGYSKSLYLIRQDNFVMTRVVHWLQNSNTLKYYEIDNLEQINGYWTPLGVKAKTVSNGETLHQTMLINSSTSLNLPLDDEIFTIRSLEKGF